MINIKRKYMYIKSNYGVTQLKHVMDMYDKLYKHLYYIAKVAGESKDITMELREILHQFKSNLPTMDATTENAK